MKISNITLDFELLERQEYREITMIPIKTGYSNLDLLTLKKGFELGLVEVSECEESTVNEIMISNKSTTPLVLINDEEIVGAKQNRIVNVSMLVPQKTTMKIPVSCVEQGRWNFKENFKQSEYMANSSTRRKKARHNFRDANLQSEVWQSVDTLDERLCVESPTRAMHESYEHERKRSEDYLKHFHIEGKQTGAIILINDNIVGMELFHNHKLYSEYHEKILKSYIIDTNQKQEAIVELDDFIDALTRSKYTDNNVEGMGKNFRFTNEYGNGSLLSYENNLIHMSYLKKII